MSDRRGHLTPISVAQMVEVDRLVVQDFGITLVQMMENAGRGLGELARVLLGGSVGGRKVVVLAGKGTNGGGGLVAARHLANAGARVIVALAGAPGELGEVPEQQRGVLALMAVEGSGQRTPADALFTILKGADLILDALIGYSLQGAPREPIAGFIRAANAVRMPRLSLDLPSGLDGDSGLPSEPTVRAQATLTLAWPKAGLLATPARPFVGDLYLADISVPEAVYHAVGVSRGSLFAEGPIVRIAPADGTWHVVAN